MRLTRKLVTPAILKRADQFMNLVLEDADEVVSESEVRRMGMIVVRGSSITQLECLEG